jgi:hypothetical protein
MGELEVRGMRAEKPIWRKEFELPNISKVDDGLITTLPNLMAIILEKVNDFF